MKKPAFCSRAAGLAAAATCFAITATFTPVSAQDAAKKPDAAKAAEAGKPKSAKPAAAAKTPPKPPTPAVHKVKSDLFELKIEVDGVFESANSTRISVIPKAWGDLTVVEAAPHGTTVKKGDILARFDTVKLAEQVDDLEKARPLAELTFKLAQQELAALEKTTPLTLEAARNAKMHAEEDLAYWEDKGREMDERDAKENVSQLENYLLYSREELNQLEKMYKADDLTEETEEIILKRARDSVHQYVWNLEQTKARTERQLTTSIPRRQQTSARAVKQQQIAWRMAEATLPEQLKQKRLEIAGQERGLKKSAGKLDELRSDLEALTVRAPHDGIVYYGVSSRGKWITASTVARKLIPGQKVMPREIFMTLVKPDPLQIRAAVPEAKMQHLATGLEGIAAPAWNPDAEFKTKVRDISFVPYSNNTFDAFFTVPKRGEDAPALYPGMNCKIRIDLYKNEKALAVPKKAVRKEGNSHFVYLKDGKKRKVKTGKSNATMTEILEGLKEGDEVKSQ